MCLLFLLSFECARRVVISFFIITHPPSALFEQQGEASFGCFVVLAQYPRCLCVRNEDTNQKGSGEGQ